MSKPNRDLEMAGWSLQNNTASDYTAALDCLNRDLAASDGFTSGTEAGMAVTSTAELTSVEAAVEARWLVQERIDNLRCAHQAAREAIRALQDLCLDAIRTRAATAPQTGTCGTGQRNLDGHIVWGDPACPMPGVKKGMCLAHYMRWYRSQQAAGRDLSAEHDQPAFDLAGALRSAAKDLLGPDYLTPHGTHILRDAAEIVERKRT